MSCPDPYRPDDPLAEATPPSAELKVQNLVPSDVEVRGLATALAASGGGVSSKDLALDLVLNQIVEQACLATGATGAAIALTRDGEMVCRATTGRNAPDLGVRLDNAGFSAECLRVGTLQRCDDTDTDPRVDAMACRLLGVRSILVIPLWYWGEFMGIFEIFSPRPNAFGERDEQTLQALAYRIVRQAKQATGPIAGFTASSEIPPPTDPAPSSIPSPAPTPIRLPEAEPVRAGKAAPVFELTPAKPSHEPADLWTMVLAGCAILIACAIVGLMIWRVGWGGDDEKKAAAAPETVQASTAQPSTAQAPPAADAGSALPEEILELNPRGAPPKASIKSAAGTPGSVVISASKKSDALLTSPVGLAVYEKGKLIYGTPISDPDASGASKDTPKPQAVPSKPRLLAKNTPLLPSATDAGKSRFVQLSPAAADDLLTTRIEPDYPDAARRARVQGSVTMDMLIGADGKVLQVSPIGGSPQLADAAIAAVHQWRYKPYVVKGKKVPVHTQATVTFMLPQ